MKAEGVAKMQSDTEKRACSPWAEGGVVRWVTDETLLVAFFVQDICLAVFSIFRARNLDSRIDRWEVLAQELWNGAEDKGVYNCFPELMKKRGFGTTAWKQRLSSVTGGAYKASDGALTLMTGFLCDDSASLQARGERHLFFADGYRVYEFTMHVLELPLYVGMNTKFFDRPSPEVPIYKTGEMISCLFRVLKIELSQPLEYRSNRVFDDF